MNILLVCTGNICRSPMAEGFHRQLLPMHEFISAGICAQEGAPADPLAVELMWQSGVDISAHRARQLSSWMMREADLVLVMERDQQKFVQRRYPTASTRIELLSGANGADIPDPYLLGLPAFQRAHQLIRAAVHSRIPQLRHRGACGFDQTPFRSENNLCDSPSRN